MRRGWRRVIVIAHGIHTSRKDADRWMGGLEKFLRSKLPTPQQVKSDNDTRWGTSVGDDIVQFRYGWTSGIMIRLPIVGWFSRRRRTKKFQKLVARIRKRARQPVHIDVIAHSFATWIAYYSTCRGKERMRTELGRVVFMGSIVSALADFPGDRFERVLNLHSEKDAVVRLGRYTGFGSSGIGGFMLEDDPRVQNVDLTPYEHDSYLEPRSRAWLLAADFLRD